MLTGPLSGRQALRRLGAGAAFAAAGGATAGKALNPVLQDKEKFESSEVAGDRNRRIK